MATKTNAMRLLEQLGIRYKTREYEVDVNDLSAGPVAAKIGLPPEQVFKTLVVRGDRNGVAFAVIPADTVLDLKAMAQAAGDRKTEPVPLSEVLPLTGYVRGGVTALAARKNYPVWVEEMAQIYDVISVSAGMRGTQLLLSPSDYIRAVGGRYAAIATSKSG